MRLTMQLHFNGMCRVACVCAYVFAANCTATARAGRSQLAETTDRDVLPAGVIPAMCHTAYEAIVRMRPEYLQPRVQPTRVMLPVAYLDGAKLASLEMLRLIPAESLVEIRFMHGGPAAVALRL